MRNVEFDSIGAKLFVNGKVGEDYVRVISSAPSLAVWLDCHPSREDTSAPVWAGFGPYSRRDQLSYAAACKMLKEAARRAGIRKRVHFYLFRHTRIDETQGKLTEAQQCMMFGWKFGSRMPGVYFKRSGRHIDDAQAIMNGITKPPEAKPATLKPKNCSRCRTDNSPASKFCNRCGNVLDIETAVKVDEARSMVEKIIEKLVQDPKKIEELTRLVK